MGSVVVDYGSLQNVLGDCICSRIGMIGGGDPMVVLFLFYNSSTEANGGIHWGKSVGVGRDETIKIIF